MTDCCGSWGRVHRRGVAGRAVGCTGGNKAGGSKSQDQCQEQCKVGNTVKTGVFQEWGAFTPSLCAGGRVHRIKWRKRRPLEPDNEGHLMQIRLRFKIRLMHRPLHPRLWEKPYQLCLHDHMFF